MIHGGRVRSLLQRDRRCGRAVRCGRQAAARVLPGAGGRRHARPRYSQRPTRDRPACSSSPTASAATSGRRPARMRPHARDRRCPRRRANGQPLPRPRLPRTAARRSRRHGASIFCLVKTSNEGGEIQDLKLSDGLRSDSTWQSWSRSGGRTPRSASGGFPSVGAVVGATHPRAVGGRRLLPQSILLLPGVGAQGASRETSRAPSPAGLPAPSSRLRARSSTPSGRRPRPTGAPPRPRRQRG